MISSPADGGAHRLVFMAAAAGDDIAEPVIANANPVHRLNIGPVFAAAFGQRISRKFVIVVPFFGTGLLMQPWPSPRAGGAPGGGAPKPYGRVSGPTKNGMAGRV
jgi:hypothetical protein